MMPGDSLTLTFDVTNTGARKGDEIVQVYLHDRESSITVYDKMLRGFERVRDIAPGETRTVRITLPAEAFRMLGCRPDLRLDRSGQGRGGPDPGR